MAQSDPTPALDALALPPKNTSKVKPICPVRLTEYVADIKEWIAKEKPGVFVAKNSDKVYTDALTEFRKHMGWKEPKYRIRARQIWAEVLAELGYIGVDIFVAGKSFCVLVLNIEKTSWKD